MKELAAMACAALVLCAGDGFCTERGDDEPWESGSKMEAPDRTDRVFAREAMPLELLAMGMIRLYQVLISPQDIPSCNFVPSCSHFGMEAIRRYGVIQGGLMTSDRLQRCTPWARTRGHYPWAEDGWHAFDPVERHRLWGKATTPRRPRVQGSRFTIHGLQPYAFIRLRR